MPNYAVPTTDQMPAAPKLRIEFRGLGVLLFNNEISRAEVGYVKVTGHETFMEIIVSGQNNGSRIPISGKTLSITAAGNNSVRAFEKTSDLNNLNLIMDLSKLYGEGQLKTNTSLYDAKIFINDAVFCSDKGSYPARVQPFYSDTNSDLPDIGEMIISRAIHAATEHQNLTVTLDGKQVDEIKPGINYDILIWSRCPNDTESDFNYYYDLLQTPNRDRVNIRYIQKAPSWLTDAEFEIFKDLGNQLNDLYFKEKVLPINPADEADLLVKLKWLAEIKCVDQPCLMTTFAHQSRSLP